MDIWGGGLETLFCPVHAICTEMVFIVFYDFSHAVGMNYGWFYLPFLLICIVFGEDMEIFGFRQLSSSY